MSSILTNHGFSHAFSQTGTRTQALTLDAGTGRKLIACSINPSGTKTTSSATFDGASMPRVGTAISYGGMVHDWFYCDIADAKGAASYNVVLTFSSSSSDNNTLIAWTTSGDTAGAPVLSSGTRAAGTATVVGSIGALNLDALLTVASRLNTSGTTWSSCASSQVTFGSTSDTSGAGIRLGRSHAIGDATETVTATWTTNDTADDLLMTFVNTTPPSGSTVAKSVFPFFLG